MKFNVPKKKVAGENLVPLINVVFLILIFFLAASVIRPFSDKDIKLATTEQKTTSPNMKRLIFVGPQGPMLEPDTPASSEIVNKAVTAWLSDKDKPITIVADHRIAAVQALEVVERIKSSGLSNINLLTQKGRQ